MDTNFSKAKIFMVTAVIVVVLISPTTFSFAKAQVSIVPPSPSVGAMVANSYFAAAPSTYQPELVGPLKVMRSATVDVNAMTVTLPLYLGRIQANSTSHTPAKNIWYILTDTNDKGNADQLGLNFSPKLAFSNVGHAVRVATLENNTGLTFNAGTVDFSPNRTVVPGAAPNYFPPKVATPGAVGDKDYSPLVRIQNAGNVIYNAPIVAAAVDAKVLAPFCTGTPDYRLVSDQVVHICPGTGPNVFFGSEASFSGTVTLKLTQGFSFGRPVLYLTTDSNNAVGAALQDVTYAPALRAIATGHDDSFASAIERLFAIVNGPTGKDNPQRQGLDSAIIDGLSPLNVLGGIPTVATDYSPLWDVNLATWTQKSLANHYDSRLNGEFQILGFVNEGWMKFGQSGIIVNCPIVMRLL
jgi:hypothetical protein